MKSILERFQKITIGAESRLSLLMIKLYQMSLEIYKEKYLFWSKKSIIFALALRNEECIRRYR